MYKFQWINIFIRDTLLSLVIAWINWRLDYKLWVGGLLAGMMVVLVSWHLSDFLAERRAQRWRS